MNITEIFDKVKSEVSRITGFKFNEGISEADVLHQISEIPSFAEQTNDLNEQIANQETRISELSADIDGKITNAIESQIGLQIKSLKEEFESKLRVSESKFSKEILSLKETSSTKEIGAIETSIEPIKVEAAKGEAKIYGGKTVQIIKA